MIIVLESGWEEWRTVICPECQARLRHPGGADLAADFLLNGGCGHPEPGEA